MERRRLPILAFCFTVAATCQPASRETASRSRPPHAPEVAARASGLAVVAGFTERVVWSGLTWPTAMRFASDGRVFVAEKSGLIKMFASLAASEPVVVADLRPQVLDFWDRGLLDIAVDPEWPARPYLYALYTFDGRVGDSLADGSVPRYRDSCANPVGSGGCVAAGRLVRLTFSSDPSAVAASEEVLVENWGQQFPSHSIGGLAFGPDGMLYASGGDGASYEQVDYGQLGGNPLRDPPDPVDFQETPPGAMGGALRAQVVQPPPATPPFPTWFNGKVIRIDPRAGEPLRNPAAVPASPSPIIASGLRNPFRITFRPGSTELWVGDVGWYSWEEIDRIPDATTRSAPLNFGWPCYEGAEAHPAYLAVGLDLCALLYGTPAGHTAPVFAYHHDADVKDGDQCGGGAAITGLAFRGRGAYPAEYEGALFFADYARTCLWAMPAGADGRPDPARRHLVIRDAAWPVQVITGPEEDIYYVGATGVISRLEYSSGNHPPRAVVATTPAPALGPAPLVVGFDGSGSSDPDPGEAITHAWDLDGDGAFDDGNAATATFTYATRAALTARLRVTDARGASTVADVPVRAGHTAPIPVIDTPGHLLWRVGETIAFSGHATDAEDGAVPAARLRWSVVLQHCPADRCHEHLLQTFTGVAAGSFVAPSHDYPMHIELRLTATDADGLAATTPLALHPRVSRLTLTSSPPGASLALNGTTGVTPFTTTVIVGASTSVSAPSQVQGTAGLRFLRWSDGGAQSHSLTAPAADATFTAEFHSLPLAEVKAQATQVVARVPHPGGGGSRNLETIRDGVRPAVGSTASDQQFDSYDYPAVSTEDWVGYLFGGARTFARLVFQEGIHFHDGGWFESLVVQVRRGGVWVPVAGLRATPAYAGNNEVNYQTFTLDFEPVAGDGIRLFGRPGGSTGFISVAELDVWAAPAQASPAEPPIAHAGPDQDVESGAAVALDGSASFDANGDALTYAWTQTGGPNVTLAGAGGPRPTFTAPAVNGPTPLTFGLTVRDGSTSSAADQVVVTVLAPLGRNVTGPARIIARVTQPLGGGSANLEVIRDGDRPAPGSQDSARQYDTYRGDTAATEDWIGYEVRRAHQFTRVVFQEGRQFGDGGWFASGPTVQVRQNGAWTAVSNVRVRPAYPGANGVTFETFQLDFDRATGDAIRIHGAPGGSARFISVGELEIYGAELAVAAPPGTDLTAAASAIIAHTTMPTGVGSRNLEILRDGDRPPPGTLDPLRQYDTFQNRAPAPARDWIGYQFRNNRAFTGLLFQEGLHYFDGGWFTSVSVEVWNGLVWRAVSGLTITPVYTGNDGVSYDTYRLEFNRINGSRIRIIGPAGGSARFFSVAELRVYGP